MSGLLFVKTTRGLFCVFLFLGWCQIGFANDNIFMHAVKNDDVELIAHLAKTQPNIDLTDASGKSALMVAAKAGNSELVKLLLDKGAQPEKTNNNGGNAVMFACIKGDIETVRLLLSNGVNVNARGSNGWSALMIASAKGHAEVVTMLLDEHADVNTVDVYDWTPLHRASFENNEQVVKVLLAAPQLKLDARDDQGATALHHAAIQGNLHISRLLIEYGASVQTVDLKGLTPENYAQQKGFDDLAVILNSSAEIPN